VRPFAWRVDRQQARDAFDHNAADLRDGQADQRDAAGRLVAVGV
jgi:hypothetical protein